MAIELGLKEEQEMLKTMARDFLANECPKTFVRQMMDDEVGHSPELWKKMADLGWQGLVFPEEYGGSAMNFRDLTILSEEMGRAVLPGPFYSTVVLVGLPIQDFGTEEQKQEFLPKIASGEIACTLAALEESGDLWAEDIKATNTSSTAPNSLLTMPGQSTTCWLLLAPSAPQIPKKE